MRNYTNHREILKEQFDKVMLSVPIKPGMHILEIGAGATNAQEWFKEIFADATYEGIDNGSEYMQDESIMLNENGKKFYEMCPKELIGKMPTVKSVLARERAIKERLEELISNIDFSEIQINGVDGPNPSTLEDEFNNLIKELGEKE